MSLFSVPSVPYSCTVFPIFSSCNQLIPCRCLHRGLCASNTQAKADLDGPSKSAKNREGSSDRRTDTVTNKRHQTGENAAPELPEDSATAVEAGDDHTQLPLAADIDGVSDGEFNLCVNLGEDGCKFGRGVGAEVGGECAATGGLGGLDEGDDGGDFGGDGGDFRGGGGARGDAFAGFVYAEGVGVDVGVEGVDDGPDVDGD